MKSQIPTLQKCSFASVSLLIYSCLFYLLYLPSTNAQVIPDNTLPNNSIAPLNCINCEITGGTVAGNNLFHSFEQFSIPTGGRAFFNNSVNVQNIFTRITGRSPSNIDGILQANGSANLFLLNPNGISFRRNASLNIGGSFFATTGDRINFADGSQFSTINTQQSSLLTISTPIGLQIGQNAGSIINQSQSSINGAVNTLSAAAGLQVPSGEAIFFIGNGIFFENGNLTARGGRVELYSLANAQVNLVPTRFGNSYSITTIPTSTFSNIGLANESSIDTSGERDLIASGGAILLQGHNLRLLDRTLLTSSTYQGTGDDLQLLATGFLTLNASSVSTLNRGAGRAGDVILRAHDFINLIGSSSDISASRSSLIGLSFNALGSQASGTSTGDAGNIFINTQRLSVRDGFRVEASTFGRGNGGNIQIQSDTIEVTGFNRQGIDLDRDRDLDISVGQLPSGIVSQVGIRASENVGDAGNLSITTRRLVLRQGGFISTATFASGNSGVLNINATESIDIRGATSAVTRNQYRSGIYASSEPGKNSEGQPITTTGNVGRLEITTDRLTVNDRGEISVNNRGSGSAGAATLNVRDLQIRGGGEIRASSLNSGAGGTLTVNADSIQLIGSGLIRTDRIPSSLGALARSSGQAGNLSITTSSLDILNGAEVSVSGRRTGAAGNLTINADRINLDRGRIVGSTQTLSGANIILQGQGNLELLRLRSNSSISAQAANSARGGNVRVNASDGFVIATGTDNDIIASAVEGSGGNITISAQSILGLTNQPFSPTNGTNDIDASSQFSTPGSVTLNQIDADPSRGTIELPADLVDASRLVSQNCSARGAIARTPSEFVITGRGGLSPSPLEPLNASTPQPHWITSTTAASPNLEPQDKDQARSPHSTPEIVEAQGWVRNAQGAIVLTTDSPVTTQTATAGLSCNNLP
jgi:filamentous hemagglutinin family protein